MHDMKPEMPMQDNEGGMARSELYRAAKHSMKLFQMLDEDTQLEGWVQSKITMAADYLDTVYHYMEYQMKFGSGEEAAHIDDITGDAEEGDMEEPISDMDDEEDLKEGLSYEDKLKALLEGKIEKSGVRASDKKKGKVEKSERKIYFVKLEKEGKTKGVTTQADEGESQGEVRDRVKRENMGWTVASIREKDSIDEAAEVIAKSKKKVVAEKAVSKAQQQAAGVALAAKREGKKPAGKGASAEMAKMSTKELEKFAGTKHKGLPKKKDEKVDESGFPPSPPDGATAPPPKGKDGKYPIVTSGPHKGKRWSEKTPGPTNPDFKEDRDLVKSIVKKVVEAKKKKPDDDKDGVPNWADKKPGEDDNAEKGSKPKKGQVPPQFAKKKETVKESVDLSRLKVLSGL